VRATANQSTRPLRWSPGDIADGSAGKPIGMPLSWYDTWSRAEARMDSDRFAFNRPERLPIHDLDPLSVIEEVLTDPAAARRRAALRPAPAPAPPEQLPGRRYVRHLGKVISFTTLGSAPESSGAA
jgi:hypothetical protein